VKGQNRPAVSLFALLAIMILTSALLCGCYQNNSQNTTQTPIGDSANGQKVEETGITDPLTGRKAQKVVPLVAVMVDNLGAARPQTGLGEAGVVYEMEAEAKITRFMALFAGDPPNAVGPVRSARSYYLQICKEWDALYAHVGGSKDASANIKSWGIKDLDEFRNGGEYRRDQARKAPHNVYLNIDKATKGKKQGLQPHWQFGNPAEGDPDFSKISFSYGSGNNVFYEFSASEKRYLRYINSSPHSDRESGKQIAVTNVVIQYAPHQYRGDGTACIDINVIGSGKAEFFLAGQYQEGTWQKESMKSTTRFFNAEGKEIIFPRGNTWVQVLRPGTPVEKV
jgi:hypothetical protein